jgi:hypothetical protein
VADRLIEALRARELAAVRDAIQKLEARRLAFLAGIKVAASDWRADLNAVWNGYRALHSLLQEDAHEAARKPEAARLECLDWLLQHGADTEQLAAWPPARAIIVAAFVV